MYARVPTSTCHSLIHLSHLLHSLPLHISLPLTPFLPLHSLPSLLFSPLPLPLLSSPPPPLQLAKVEKLKPTEVELKRLEDLAQSLVHDFAYMRAREEEMRDTNGLPLHPQLIPCTPPAQWCCIYATLALRTQHT